MIATDHAAILRSDAEFIMVCYGPNQPIANRMLAAAAEIERLTLVWTSERPTKPDNYWREHPGTKRQWIETMSQRELDAPHYCHGGRWAGPIPEPREPKA